MNTSVYNLPAGAEAPAVVNVIIEVPRNSSNKYEYDKALGIMKLDRVLYAAMRYPGDYGFIPSTLSGDGDPVDVVMLSTYPFAPGSLVEARVVGMLEMTDDKGRDTKVLAVPKFDPRFSDITELSDVAAHTKAEIEHFFMEYKTLEGKKVLSEGWRDREDALSEIRESMDRALGLVAEEHKV
jgi:inorganic pyrophosphatase